MMFIPNTPRSRFVVATLTVIAVGCPNPTRNEDLFDLVERPPTEYDLTADDAHAAYDEETEALIRSQSAYFVSRGEPPLTEDECAQFRAMRARNRP